MQLILVRHGVAEDRRFGLDDQARELTGAGRRKFQSTLERLRENLPDDHRITLVSSPALRASQTAELIAEALHLKRLLEEDWIYSGSAEKLRLLLAAQQAEEEERQGAPSLLILTGHQPHLSLWSAGVLGVPMMFRKGGAAAFQLNGYHPRPAHLLWSHRAQP